MSADQTPRVCSHRKYHLIIALLGVSLALSLALNARSLRDGLSIFPWRSSETPQAQDEYPQFDEEASWGDGNRKVVRIAVEGLITSGGETGWFGIPSDPTGDVIRQIRAATNDEEVAAIILEVDSPGGEVAPTDEIYNALRAFRESRDDRRIVAHVRGLAASGGYYVACAADHIVAQPTAIVGSISVIIQSLNWHTLSERVGVRSTVIASGRHKDMLNPFKPENPEHLAILQRVVDAAHARFAQIVAEGRELSETEVAAVADGSVFAVPDALEKKLVDAEGYWEDAVSAVESLLDDTVHVVRYTRRMRLSDWLARLRAPTADLTAALPNRGPRLLMLWQP